ncbi:MAG: response regulator transcription factor [Deltaproteobacteria bacterium]|nr:response regulator transcription factor [Deltaproteobacteria bacterium]
MILRCIIADDERPSRDELLHLLSEMGDVEILACVQNGKEALELLKKTRPDVVFLDIRMPVVSGFDVAREILTFPDPPAIVFATAYDEYAIQAFDIRAVDYLLKPFSRERLTETVQRLKEARVKKLDLSDLKEIIERVEGTLESKKLVRIPVADKGKILLLPPVDVFFCSTTDSKIRVCTWEESYSCGMTLNELENRLKDEHFLRVHRGCLVNLNHVRGLIPWFDGKYLLTMGDSHGTEIQVSRNNAKHLKRILHL